MKKKPKNSDKLSAGGWHFTKGISKAEAKAILSAGTSVTQSNIPLAGRTKKKPKKEVKQVVEIHIYVHQVQPYIPNQCQSNGSWSGGTVYATPSDNVILC